MTQPYSVSFDPMLTDEQRTEALGWFADAGIPVSRYATTGRVVSLLNRYYDGGVAEFVLNTEGAL